MENSPNLINRLILGASRSKKRLLMVLGDLIALPFALWSAFALRLSDWWPSEYLLPALPLFLLTAVGGVVLLSYFGLYRAVIRYLGVQAVSQIFKGIVLTSFFVFVVALVLDLSPFPRSVPIIFALVALLYVGGSRLFVRAYYYWLVSNYVSAEPVVIFGAGTTGAKLPSALRGGGKYLPICFIDDDKRLHNSVVSGLIVHSSDQLERIVLENNIHTVLLAVPSASAQKRKDLIEKVVSLNLRALTVPTMSEIISGVSENSLREVKLEDLLGRAPVPPIPELINDSIHNKTVLITGAGGSIGSEISKVVLQEGAKRILLLDSSEFALYTIEQSLSKILAHSFKGIEIIPILGSVLDDKLIKSIFNRFEVQTVYHAAAYKHVPLVEHNVINGLKNNVFGTRIVLNAAIDASVERFILVSTDKAVRPTNIMGATKRLAEIIVQAAASQQCSTTLSMVRFGNVLGSSGSVVPLFKQQIYEGGPITITHADITRFFMTIPEAASLVVQAGSMASGGEVFVLDMGEPVKIIDLAKNMIRLSGRTLKDEQNPDGDIELVVTGLRPGEKLYEELLISGSEEKTIHPKIMKAEESSVPQDLLLEKLSELEVAISDFDSDRAKDILIGLVNGYNAAPKNVDWFTNA